MTRPPVSPRAIVVLAFVLLACGKKEIEKKEATRPTGPPFDAINIKNDASFAEPGFEGAKKIAFSIQGIYTNQKPSRKPPFREPGGAWTFFDATAADGTPFGFGFDEPKRGARSFVFGKAILTAPDGSAGGRMVALFARAFEGKVPPEKPAHPIQPKPFGAVFLGVDTVRGGAGGFSGSGGGWYASKLFLQGNGADGEVFFNFSLKEKTGEFSEKDPDYANDLVKWLASELRDGPKPKRTPKSDPSLSETGPVITWGRTLVGMAYGMSPLRDRYWITQPTDGGGQTLYSVGFEREDDVIEMLSVPHRLGSVRCGGDLCLAADSRPVDASHGGAWSTDDPTTVFLVDRKKKTSVELRGEGSKPSVPQAAAAPDGSLFVVGWYRKTGVNSAHQVLYLYGPDGKERGPIEVGRAPVDVISVAKTRVVVQLGSKYGRDATLSYVAIDPATLGVSPTAAPAVDDSKLSPDKKRTVECRRQGAEIAVRELATGAEHVFAVHEDDREAIAGHCVTWASSRFLEYHAEVTGWLDTKTMKIALGLDEALAGSLAYEKDFKWAVATGESLPRLGRISVP